MQGWEKCNEKPLPKKGFYSNLNIKDIIVKNQKYGKRAWRKFGIKNWGEYFDFFVQNDILLLADVTESFQATYTELDPAYFLLAPRLSWQDVFKESVIRIINWHWYIINHRKRY